MTTAAEGQGIGKYVAVYVVLLVITVLQFVIGYQGAEGGKLVVRMLTFTLIETFLIVLFFMNLSSEKKTFIKFFAYFMIFVLLTINYGWTDSFRLFWFHAFGISPS